MSPLLTLLRYNHATGFDRHPLTAENSCEVEDVLVPPVTSTIWKIKKMLTIVMFQKFVITGPVQ